MREVFFDDIKLNTNLINIVKQFTPDGESYINLYIAYNSYPELVDFITKYGDTNPHTITIKKVEAENEEYEKPIIYNNYYFDETSIKIYVASDDFIWLVFTPKPYNKFINTTGESDEL